MDDSKSQPIYCTRHLFRGEDGTDASLSFEEGFHISLDKFEGSDKAYDRLSTPGTTDEVLIHAFSCPLCNSGNKPEPYVYIVPVPQTNQPVTYLSKTDGGDWLVYATVGMYTPRPRENPLTPSFDAEDIIHEPDTEG